MSEARYLFTSESVSMGHPDKLADRISDGVLDALLAQDPHSRVACETMVTTGKAVIAGEITTKANVDYEKIVRDVIREVGIFAERVDISEELVRLDSHLKQFHAIADSNETNGRKLDFLTQELLRETNTIGSKANHADIASHVVEIKSIIERIREMVQNVE